jgi:hypothetical protein
MKKLVLLFVAGCSGAPFTVLPDLGDSGGGSENYQPPHEVTDASEEFSFTMGHDSGAPDVLVVDVVTPDDVSTDTQATVVWCDLDSGVYTKKCTDNQTAIMQHDTNPIDCAQPSLSCPVGYCCDVVCSDPSNMTGNYTVLCLLP